VGGGQLLKASVINADSIDHLKTLEPSSIDAVVTDPPYGLGNCSSKAITEALTSWLAGDEYQPKGGGFMGKSWDAFVPGPELWREVYRVLKPGGHAVIFAGSRTVDLMGIAVRLSGFEVRDMLHWIYGSGFPKSLDVSKAIDKRAGAEREVIREAKATGTARKRKGGSHAAALVATNTEFEETTIQYTAPATAQAKQWEGWGTALKPAHEPILLCRKPLEGAVVDNVERWGVGGLNIDGCRIETDEVRIQGAPKNTGATGFGGSNRQGGKVYEDGRWPANILLDDHAASLVDIQAGLEASRFFYCAKAERGEREAGLEAFEQISGGSYQGRVDGTLGGPIPKRANVHPTVKPLAVMRWLCKLITPPGGLILDPFNGSGTTGCAAVQLGFSYLGIEREPEYAAIARARIEHWGCIKLEAKERQEPAKQQRTLF
jgi:site-specific DNA-methyltransferase (adenine-specific)